MSALRGIFDIHAHCDVAVGSAVRDKNVALHARFDVEIVSLSLVCEERVFVHVVFGVRFRGCDFCLMRRCNRLIGDKEIAVIEIFRSAACATHFHVAPRGIHDVPFSHAVVVGVDKHLVPGMPVFCLFGIGHGRDIFPCITAHTDCLDVFHAAKQCKSL